MLIPGTSKDRLIVVSWCGSATFCVSDSIGHRLDATEPDIDCIVSIRSACRKKVTADSSFVSASH